MMNLLKMIVNVLIVALFVISLSVAVYIAIKHAAPWGLISTYWITLAIKNGFDWILKCRKAVE